MLFARMMPHQFQQFFLQKPACTFKGANTKKIRGAMMHTFCFYCPFDPFRTPIFCCWGGRTSSPPLTYSGSFFEKNREPDTSFPPLVCLIPSTVRTVVFSVYLPQASPTTAGRQVSPGRLVFLWLAWSIGPLAGSVRFVLISARRFAFHLRKGLLSE